MKTGFKNILKRITIQLSSRACVCKIRIRILFYRRPNITSACKPTRIQKMFTFIQKFEQEEIPFSYYFPLFSPFCPPLFDRMDKMRALCHFSVYLEHGKNMLFVII